VITARIALRPYLISHRPGVRRSALTLPGSRPSRRRRAGARRRRRRSTGSRRDPRHRCARPAVAGTQRRRRMGRAASAALSAGNLSSRAPASMRTATGPISVRRVPAGGVGPGRRRCAPNRRTAPRPESTALRRCRATDAQLSAAHTDGESPGRADAAQAPAVVRNGANRGCRPTRLGPMAATSEEPHRALRLRPRRRGSLRTGA